MDLHQASRYVHGSAVSDPHREAFSCASKALKQLATRSVKGDSRYRRRRRLAAATVARTGEYKRAAHWKPLYCKLRSEGFCSWHQRPWAHYQGHSYDIWLQQKSYRNTKKVWKKATTQPHTSLAFQEELTV